MPWVQASLVQSLGRCAAEGERLAVKSLGPVNSSLSPPDRLSLEKHERGGLAGEGLRWALESRLVVLWSRGSALHL